MTHLFPPVDPDARRHPRRRLVPSTAVMPNLVTLLALCAGLTAIRMAMESRYELSIALIIVAIILDGIDGRLARYFRATSKFGEQLDSLADFVNFGVAPAMVLWIWRTSELSSFGWICALVLAICTGLRLARFNAALVAEETSPDWHRDFFVGVPAPAGAGLALLPYFLQRVFGPEASLPALAIALYMVVIALLMVSRLPTLSLKRTGRRIQREVVLPVLVVGVLLVALLFSYPFTFLSVAAIAYLGHIPLAWRSYRAAELRAATPPQAAPEA